MGDRRSGQPETTPHLVQMVNTISHQKTESYSTSELLLLRFNQRFLTSRRNFGANRQPRGFLEIWQSRSSSNRVCSHNTGLK